MQRFQMTPDLMYFKKFNKEMKTCVDYLSEVSRITGETIYGILSRPWKADYALAGFL